MKGPSYLRAGCWAVALAVPLCAPAQSQAANLERGRLLVENHCRSCHTSAVHRRENRKGESPLAVQGQIRRWQAHLGLDWGEEERADVFEYLNTEYYGFPVDIPPPPPLTAPEERDNR